MESFSRIRLIFIVEACVILRNQADIYRFIIRNTFEPLFVQRPCPVLGRKFF